MLIVSGALCLVDVAVTLVWQEPLSAAVGARGQALLNRELPGLDPPIGGKGILTPDEASRRAGRYGATLQEGSALGRIEFTNLGRRFTVAEGTGAETLRNGPGHYQATGLPGEGSTVGIAGHRTTYLAPFRDNAKLTSGDEITLRMPYGNFVYQVARTVVVSPANQRVLGSGKSERLVLTTCHPIYSDAQRLVVIAPLERIVPAGSMVESSRDSR